MAINYAALKEAFFDIIKEISGLPDSAITWRNQNAPTPEDANFIGMKIEQITKVGALLPCPEGRGILSGSDLMVDLPAMIDSYTLQPSIPSDGGTVTTASPRHS